MASGPPPIPVLAAALLVLTGGIAAVAVHDDGPATDTSPVMSMSLSSTTTFLQSSAPPTTRRTPTPPSTAPPTSVVATSVRASVTSPEAAANGLWAAYTASNRVAAQRFATDDVVRVLFEEPYDGEKGMFQGCRPTGDAFECDYVQPSSDYVMTVRADAAGGFEVVELTVSPSTEESSRHG